jgi:hypothetical protein
MGRDEHSFVAGQHGLTECNWTASLTYGTDSSLRIFAIWLFRERLLDFPALVTVQTAILCRVSPWLCVAWYEY